MGSNEYDGFPGWVAHMQAHYNRKVGAAAVGGGVAAVGGGVAAGTTGCLQGGWHQCQHEQQQQQQSRAYFLKLAQKQRHGWHRSSSAISFTIHF